MAGINDSDFVFFYPKLLSSQIKLVKFGLMITYGKDLHVTRFTIGALPVVLSNVLYHVRFDLHAV